MPEENCQKTAASGGIHLSQKIDYGITLLAKLASKEFSAETKSLKSISKSQNLSFSFLQKVAQQLSKKGLITSTRGNYRGYKLNQKPENIDLKSIIEALDGPLAITPCQSAKGCKREQGCQIKKGIGQINQDLNNYLLSKKLTHFIS